MAEQNQLYKDGNSKFHAIQNLATASFMKNRNVKQIGSKLQSAKYQQFAIYFKFKMENHQPKTQEIPLLERECDMFDAIDPSLEAIESRYLDQMLDQLIKEDLPPFVVTESYKIRREQESPQPESEVECINIQDKILGYNRKDKSLMELARKFIQKFEGAPSNILVLDQVTVDLNVQRRRIYDIINIMESLSVVSKIRKNVYEWKGLKKAVETIQSFSEGGWPQQNEKTKKQRSLESLATQFLKLFSQRKTYLTLQEATRVILNEANQQVKKTKIRRLYDIVNVFKCLGLVEKVKNSKSFGGKPVYQWLGCKQLLKIIQEKQQGFIHTEEHDDTLNSNSDQSSEKNSYHKEDYLKQNLKIHNQRSSDQISKMTKVSFQRSDNIVFGLKDISNTQNLMNRANICRRNSVCLSKSIQKPIISLKKQTSFTDARQKKTKQSLKNTYNNNKKDSSCSTLTNVMNDFQINEGHSFFFSLVKHLNNSGSQSVSQISDKLSQLVWPAHSN